MAKADFCFWIKHFFGFYGFLFEGDFFISLHYSKSFCTGQLDKLIGKR